MQEKQFSKWYLIWLNFPFYFFKRKEHLYRWYLHGQMSANYTYQNGNSGSSFTPSLLFSFWIIQSQSHWVGSSRVGGAAMDFVIFSSCILHSLSVQQTYTSYFARVIHASSLILKILCDVQYSHCSPCYCLTLPPPPNTLTSFHISLNSMVNYLITPSDISSVSSCHPLLELILLLRKLVKNRENKYN